MRSFTDAAGRTWRVRITVAELEAIDAELGLDLGRPGAIQQLVGSPRSFLKLLWVLIGPQIEAARAADPGFSDTALKESWSDDGVWEAAHEAVLLAVADFFRRGQQAEEMLAVMHDRRAKLTSLKNEKLATIQTAIEAGTLDLAVIPGMAMIDRLLARSSPPSTGASSSPASSASTPDPSPSGSSSE